MRRTPNRTPRPRPVLRDLASAGEHWLARHERDQDRQAEVLAERLARASSGVPEDGGDLHIAGESTRCLV
jgi:hypothetical protein